MGSSQDLGHVVGQKGNENLAYYKHAHVGTARWI